MALKLEDVDKKIKKAKPHLVKKLVLDVHLKARLQEMGVITDALQDELQPQGVTRWTQVDLLLDDIKRGPVLRFLHFCKVMHEEGKYEVLKALDVDMADIEDQLDREAGSPPRKKQRTESKDKLATKIHFYKKIDSEEKVPIPAGFLPGLLQHCEAYNMSLMKTSLFGCKNKAPIDLTEIYVHQDAWRKKNLSEKMPVGMTDMFSQLTSKRPPHCLSLEGAAGTGKSSFLEKCAYDWSKDMTSCEEKGPNVPCEGHSWKLVVYIAASGVKGTATNAIRENLRCKVYLKDQMMCDIAEDGEGVLIFFDTIEELRQKESTESISSYIETSQKTPRAPRVLVSFRDGLLPVKRRYFDRELHLPGFSLPQGITYMRQYFKDIHSITAHPILEYIETQPQHLEWVLSNPLRVHILSELTARGFLTLQDVKTLTTVKLFRSLDYLLLTRDEECRLLPPHPQPNFYQASLRCLLFDTRTLSEEDIGNESPYISLLKRHDYMDQDFNDCKSFSFIHETLFEYLAMRGLIECLMNNVDYKQAMLLWLCSNKKMRNFLQLTCGYIAQYEPRLLPDMVYIIRASLILHAERAHGSQNELTQELLQLPDIIKQTFPPHILTHGLSPEEAAKLGKVSNLILAIFSEKAEQLKEMAWFVNGYSTDRIFMDRFLLGCLHQLTLQQQQNVFSQTMTPLLPCTRVISASSFVTVVPVAGVRWATVRGTTETGPLLDVTIRLWAPCDLSSALPWSGPPKLLQQLNTQQLRVKYRVFIDRSAHKRCTSLPADPWSEEQWALGLRELLSPTYCTRAICVDVGRSKSPSPLSGLLSSCKKIITPGHGLTGGLLIWRGQVTEDELTEFCTWACKVGLILKLRWVRVVLRAGRCKDDVETVDSTIRRMVEVDVGGWLRGPTYLTAEGVLYKNYSPH